MSGPTVCDECDLPRARLVTHRHICRCNYDADDIREVLSEAEKEADAAEAEVTRLRAALRAIANLQPDEPSWEGARHDLDLGEMRGRHEASSLAAAALVKP